MHDTHLLTRGGIGPSKRATAPRSCGASNPNRQAAVPNRGMVD
jgi:hypothetical protein